MKTKKNFLITIDTEGDNLWRKDLLEAPVTTRNTEFLPQFQTLCAQFDFIPVYLTDYEMACDPEFVDFGKNLQDSGLCEIGMHLHAWNTPPDHPLPASLSHSPASPYLIEYPEAVMDAKIHTMTTLITQQFGVAPVTHRAGRWAMDDRYFRLLTKYDYRCDCSVTPRISWAGLPGWTEGSQGADYRNSIETPHMIHRNASGSPLWEVPVTVLQSHKVFWQNPFLSKKNAKSVWHAVKGETLWLRPDGKNLPQLLYLTEKIAKGSTRSLMFMLHSSELMPGGSPTFQTEKSVEKLYNDLAILFERAARDFSGISLREYCTRLNQSEDGS